jgi:ParB/RepB/Spo0J family partition protein
MDENGLLDEEQEEMVANSIMDSLAIMPIELLIIPKVEVRKELTESIRQKGVLKPPVIVPMPSGKYTVTQGKHRVVSAVELGLTEIECIVDEVQDAVEQDVELLTDNILRQRNYGDEAQAVERLLKSGLSEADICQRLGGVSLTVIKELMRLKRSMAPKAFKAVKEGKVGRAVALKLSRLGHAAQIDVVKEEKITVKDADAALRVQKDKQFNALYDLVIPSISPDEETALKVEALAQKLSGESRTTLINAAAIIRMGQ